MHCIIMSNHKHANVSTILCFLHLQYNLKTQSSILFYGNNPKSYYSCTQNYNGNICEHFSRIVARTWYNSSGIQNHCQDVNEKYRFKVFI